ncbi:MAG: GNAT family N-acetyltransferase [Polynucleobacter sp.]|uniref:GNAT family N-acetyltransferase n=1 Tax=Polynucleobacter sp. TaxID=2029855 RepID=UPI00271FDA43|nr:GNAT family N-acetyltransferase [Polynucleobacter sp.]MDO8713110.1 GNAT family N-acetyltransferase [Polynucleobacter sp.]
MKIMLAEISDIPDLVHLLGLLFDQELEFQANPSLQSESLVKIILDPSLGIIFVAKKNAQTIGMVSLLFTQSTALGSRVALLEDLVVSPAFRRNGVGSALISYAISMAKISDCKRITLLTDSSNSVSKKFYLSHHFTQSSMSPYRLLLN